MIYLHLTGECARLGGFHCQRFTRDGELCCQTTFDMGGEIVCVCVCVLELNYSVAINYVRE